MDGIPERLIELETRYMHLERQVEVLNDIVTSQQALIDTLVKRLGGVIERVGHLGDSPTNERPPHY